MFFFIFFVSAFRQALFSFALVLLLLAVLPIELFSVGALAKFFSLDRQSQESNVVFLLALFAVYLLITVLWLASSIIAMVRKKESVYRRFLHKIVGVFSHRFDRLYQHNIKFVIGLLLALILKGVFLMLSIHQCYTVSKSTSVFATYCGTPYQVVLLAVATILLSFALIVIEDK